MSPDDSNAPPEVEPDPEAPSAQAAAGERPDEAAESSLFERSAESQRGERPKWFAPLVVGLLFVVVLVVWWFSKGAQRPRRLSALCFRAIFEAQDHYRASLVLDEYRKEAADPIPIEVRDEIYKLRTERYAERYPLVHDEMGPYLIANVAFFSLASDSALQGAQTEEQGAMRALRYVSLHVQSGTGSHPIRALPVGAIHALYRGYGDASQVAWIMANLLRYRGIHACVIQLPRDPETRRSYFLTGAMIRRRMYLFDPYRCVPLCRARDGRIAHLGGLLGGDRLAPGFGGPGSPVTVDELRRAAYLIPAGSGNILPDAWLVQQVVNDNGRHDVIYRSFRRDLRRLAAVVFGTGSTGQATYGGDYTRIVAEGRRQVCALWPLPFHIEKLGTQVDYVRQLDRIHGPLQVYHAARSRQLFGDYPAARDLYAAAAKHENLPAEAAEDIRFFRAIVTATADQRAEQLGRYLNAYPDGRWRPLATFHLATLYAQTGQFEPALELAARLDGPYRLVGELLRQAATAGKRRIVWSYPGQTPPPGGMRPPSTTAPAAASTAPALTRPAGTTPPARSGS
jgi:hypothetical protein